MTTTQSSPRESLLSHVEKIYFEREAMIQILLQNGVPDWKDRVESFLQKVNRNDQAHQEALGVVRQEIDQVASGR